MKTRTYLSICLLFCLLVLSGCFGKQRPMQQQGITDVDACKHAPGQWQEVTDVVAATVTKTQYCTTCNELIASETEPLTSMIRNGLFLFTPNEFLERFTALASQHTEGFSYEFVPEMGSLANIYSNDKQAILQFFRRDATLLKADELDTAEVWCVSLTGVDKSDATLRYCFLMACDPTLTMDSAFEVDIELSTALLNAAANGKSTGYYQNNGMLYEHIYLPAQSMNLVNIYASDFR